MPASNQQLTPKRVCVLITSFNRKELTLKCISSLEAMKSSSQFSVSLILVDDGSTDGTAAAIESRHPWVKLFSNHDKPLFWCRGMHRALAEAVAIGYDHYILLNDDTALFEDALARLLDCEHQLREAGYGPCVVVGSTQDRVGGERTYGGEKVASRYRPIKLISVQPSNSPQALDTFNGNIVLIPAEVVARVGNLDPAYEHAFGDIDYGLRARKAGFGVWLAPGFHGVCQLNPIKGTYRDTDLPFWVRWRLLTGRKSLPIRSWSRFTRQHTGLLWPVYLVLPYLKFLMSLGRW